MVGANRIDASLPLSTSATVLADSDRASAVPSSGTRAGQVHRAHELAKEERRVERALEHQALASGAKADIRSSDAMEKSARHADRLRRADERVRERDVRIAMVQGRNPQTTSEQRNAGTSSSRSLAQTLPGHSWVQLRVEPRPTPSGPGDQRGGAGSDDDQGHKTKAEGAPQGSARDTSSGTSPKPSGGAAARRRGSKHRIDDDEEEALNERSVLVD